MGSSKIIALLLLFAGLVYGDAGQNLFGILNGERTDISKHPYQAAIFRNGVYIGSGAILNKDFVITYVHTEDEASELKVGVGKTTLTDMEKRYDIEQIFVHPKYSFGTNYAVSIIKLTESIEFSTTVKPITIATQSAKGGSTATISGWGLLNLRRRIRATDLVKKDQTIITKEKCKPYYLGSIVSDTIFCAYNTELDRPTAGDSGSPLVQKNKLIGLYLVDYASPTHCLKKTCPSLYTDVTLLRDWVSETIENN